MANAPTITWYLCNSDGSQTKMDNVVNYDAVQAGSYSNVICVKPKMDATNAASIGKVRFWWHDINGAVSGGTEDSLPSHGWVMKYYVSYCDNYSLRTASSDSLTPEQRQAHMSDLFAKPQVKMALTSNQILATSDATVPSSLSSFSLSTYYCKSTWQSSDDKNYVCMQPVPFFTSDKTGFTSAGSSSSSSFVGGEIDNFTTHYGKDWVTDVFGSSTPIKVDGKPELYYSVGGVLNGNGKGCNLTEQVTTEDGFPYIFLTIRPPTTADAGVWSGFSCRLSFVWPWTSTNTGSVSTVS